MLQIEHEASGMQRCCTTELYLPAPNGHFSVLPQNMCNRIMEKVKVLNNLSLTT
jgi:hypothetical protein